MYFAINYYKQMNYRGSNRMHISQTFAIVYYEYRNLKIDILIFDGVICQSIFSLGFFILANRQIRQKAIHVIVQSHVANVNIIKSNQSDNIRTCNQIVDFYCCTYCVYVIIYIKKIAINQRATSGSKFFRYLIISRRTHFNF